MVNLKKNTMLSFILVTLIMVNVLIPSCTQEETTETTTETTTITNTIEVTNTQTMTSTITNTQPPTTTSITTTPPMTTTTTIPPIATAGELANFGGTLYNKNCANNPECHARFDGGGGEIQLSGGAVSKLGNAETVFGVISSIMHLAIGSMEENAPTLEEYLKILAYVLIQTDLIQSGDPFDRNMLPNILLKPPPTIPPTTTPPLTTATWGELAARGAGAFSSICAACHGVNGGGGSGPEIIGTSLRVYRNAWRLLAFISTAMPWDGPGSLSITSYTRILAFMLIESGFVQPEVIFNESDLVNVILE